MIERFYLKACLSFGEVTLELKPGLIVFSGPSGSGKSVLMRAILSSVGLDDPIAALSESSVSWEADEARSGLVNESPNVLREVKKEKARYFFNSQSLSRSAIAAISRRHLRHLSVKDYSDFDAQSLLELIDGIIAGQTPGHAEKVQAYHESYLHLQYLRHELLQLIADEKQRREQEEFARFEVRKIDEIDPKPDEYEALLEVKKTLSRKEKLEERLTEAFVLFEHEYTVSQVLGELEIDSAFFDDTMNELRGHFERAQERFSDLENTDIESVLDRLETLSDLKRRYGSIEEALAYRDQKARELENYETLGERIAQLQAESDTLTETLVQEAGRLSETRAGALGEINSAINGYLSQLYLEGAELSLEQGELGPKGHDNALLSLKGTPLQQISSGEFNRLRLALLAVKSKSMQGQQGVLMLDEIDANLSGEESMSVAKVLRTLSRHFQILVISHQPQLTAMGEQHFLVSKEGESSVRELRDDAERIEEIARIVSGETITPEARNLARELLNTAAKKEFQ